MHDYLIWDDDPKILIHLFILQMPPLSIIELLCKKLPLHDHKSVDHITEYQDDDTDESVADGLFCFVIFLLISCTREYEESCIYDHDDDDECDKSIEKDYNLCHCSEDSRGIEDTIGTICWHSKYSIPTTISSSIGYTHERLSNHHNHKTEYRANKYFFTVLKSFFISNCRDHTIECIDSTEEKDRCCDITEEIENRVDDIYDNIVHCLSADSLSIEYSCFKLTDYCVGY